MKRYEAMFLLDNTNVHQWSDMEAEVRRLFDRIQADLLVCVKFDERKLAYEIKGCKRGTYVLTYFDADPGRITDLERDTELSEPILRTLVLRADKISQERLDELKAWPADQPLQPVGGDGRRGEGAPTPSKRYSAIEPAKVPDRSEEDKKEGGDLPEPKAEMSGATDADDQPEVEPETAPEPRRETQPDAEETES